MRLAFALLLVGCSDGYDVWVTYTPSRLSVMVFSSPCETTSLPAPGDCSVWTDGSKETCQIAMPACTDRVHLEKEGVTVAEGSWVMDNPPPADELVIDGCSKEMRVPLGVPPPPPSITAFDGSNVTWALAGPAERVTVYSGTHFVLTTCAVSPSTTSFTLPDPHDHWVQLTAWSALVTSSVALGDAHVRVGAGSAN